MKVQDVLVYPEWLQVAEWVRDHLDSKQYTEAYKERRAYTGSKKTKTNRSYMCNTHNQTRSSMELRHVGVKDGKICTCTKWTSVLTACILGLRLSTVACMDMGNISWTLCADPCSTAKGAHGSNTP